MVLFNPTLNIRTSNNPFDWSALSYVEMTNSIWSSRSVGSSVDDIVDVSTLTFSMPIFINPPAKVKQQKLIYNIINELYSLDDEDLDAFVAKENFDKTTLQYTVITLDNRKLKYENGKAYLYNEQGTQLDASGNTLEWATELKPFGDLREGISQLRLRKSNNPGDSDNDIIGRLEFDANDKNALVVTVDAGTLPANSLSAIDAVINPQANYPGDGTVTAAAIGQRYLLTNDLPISTNWTNAVAGVDDIIEYNGTAWVVSFDSSTVSDQKYVTNISSTDQLEWNGTDWFNSHEGMYKAGFWRIYI